MRAVNLSIAEYLTVDDGNSLLFVEPPLSGRKSTVIRHIRRRRTPTREPVRTSAEEFFLLSGPGPGDLRARPTAVGKEQTGFERAVPLQSRLLYCTAVQPVRLFEMCS
jgi:hypothetical protein